MIRSSYIVITDQYHNTFYSGYRPHRPENELKSPQIRSNLAFFNKFIFTNISFLDYIAKYIWRLFCKLHIGWGTPTPTWVIIFVLLIYIILKRLNYHLYNNTQKTRASTYFPDFRMTWPWKYKWICVRGMFLFICFGEKISLNCFYALFLTFRFGFETAIIASAYTRPTGNRHLHNSSYWNAL